MSDPNSHFSVPIERAFVAACEACGNLSALLKSSGYPSLARETRVISAALAGRALSLSLLRDEAVAHLNLLVKDGCENLEDCDLCGDTLPLRNLQISGNQLLCEKCSRKNL